MKRQTCCRCLRTTDNYTTELVDRRTPAEVKAGREPSIGRFHTCHECNQKGTTP